MIKLSKRTTIYMDPQVHKILKMKALETSRSISDIVDEAVRAEFMEEQEDLAAISQRKNEPDISYQQMLEELKNDGKI